MTTAGTASYNTRRLTELAKDPQNEVYKYEDNPNRPVIIYDPEVSLERWIKLRIQFDKVRSANAHWSDADVRQYIVRSNLGMLPFINVHPSIANAVFDSKQSNDQISKLFKSFQASISRQKKDPTTKYLVGDTPDNQQTVGAGQIEFVQQLLQNKLVTKPK